MNFSHAGALSSQGCKPAGAKRSTSVNTRKYEFGFIVEAATARNHDGSNTDIRKLSERKSKIQNANQPLSQGEEITFRGETSIFAVIFLTDAKSQRNMGKRCVTYRIETCKLKETGNQSWIPTSASPLRPTWTARRSFAPKECEVITYYHQHGLCPNSMSALQTPITTIYSM